MSIIAWDGTATNRSLASGLILYAGFILSSRFVPDFRTYPAPNKNNGPARDPPSLSAPDDK